MGYIENSLLAEEKILYRGQKHVFVFAFTVFWFVIGTTFLLTVQNTQKLAIIPLLLSLIIGYSAAIEYFFSEIAVTNMFLLAKFGFFRKIFIETPLQNIRSIEVKKTFWGKIFNYGSVKLCNINDQCLSLDRLTSPILFKNRLEKEIEQRFPNQLKRKEKEKK